MNIVTTLKDNITARVASVLGSEFSQLSYVIDLGQNKFNRASKRYGVLPSGASEVAGTVGVNTLDHTFTIILTDSFNAGPASQVGDVLKVERINELQDKALEIYKDLQVYKSSLSSQALIVFDLDVSEVEFLEEDKIAVLRFGVTVKYKI